MVLWLILAGVGAFVVLFALAVFLMMGGTGMLESKWTTMRRGFVSDQPMVAGRALRLKVPKGFEPVAFLGTPDIPEDDGATPFAQVITDDVVVFDLLMGYYTPINNKEWSARMTIEFGRTPTTPLERLPGNWKQATSQDMFRSESFGLVGYAVSSAAQSRRLQLVAKREVYTSEQCERMARESFASLDPFAVSAVLAKRDARIARMPANRAAALRVLEEEAGFRPLPVKASVPVENSKGDIFYFHEGLESGVMWIRLGTASSLAGLREDVAATGPLVRQPHTRTGIVVTQAKGGEVESFRLTGGSQPISEFRAPDPFLPGILSRSEIGIWRVDWTPVLTNDPAPQSVRDWLADSERLRASATKAWKFVP